MRLSDIKGHRVMAAGAATTVGRVSGVVVDPRAGTVVALRVAHAPGGDTLPWPEISGFGPDAVMVGSPDAIRGGEQRSAPCCTDQELIGKRLLTDGGNEAGTLADLTFDPQDGRISALHLGDRSVPGDHLLACGSYAVVVRSA